MILAGVEIYIDWATWIQLNISILYVLPLVLAARSRSRVLLWGLAGLLAVATFVVYVQQKMAAGLSLGDPYLINRILSLVAMSISALLLHILIDVLDELDARGREAREESGRKTRFLASISHDLRTPLTTINLISDFIHDTAGTAELATQQRLLAHDLQKISASLSELVANAFDIAQIDAGRNVLHESDFFIQDLLVDEAALLEPAAAAKSLYLRTTAPAGIKLRTDRVKLGRVVRNIIANAIKFTKEGGVRVSAAIEEDGNACIYVQDTGLGIHAGDRERIFDEFTRLRSQESETAGWGLGLAISRRLVILMGGAVSATSGEHGGSLFKITLPSSRVVEGSVCGKPLG